MNDPINSNEPNSGGDFHITRRVELNFWRTCFFNAAGLLLAWLTNSDIQFTSVFSFAVLVVLIWFLNWIMRPILVVFTLPFIIFTMGVGMLFINAIIIYFAARLVPGDCIIVGSYWAALWASFLVSVLSWGVAMARSERTIRAAFAKKRSGKDGDDNNNNSDVIDV